MEHLTDVAVFVKVVEEGSLSAAAKSLGLSRAAVSKYLSRLEERLGARLLHRTTRQLGLTEAGATLFESGRTALSYIEDAEQAISRLQSEPRGSLRVNAPMTFGILELAPALPAFLRAHRGISIELCLDDRIVDLVAERFDVAVRIAKLSDSNLVARKLAVIRQAVCAAPAYLEEFGTPETPEDLAAHNCILYSYASAGSIWSFTAPDGREIKTAVKGSLRVNNGIAEREAAAQGFGIIHSPNFYVAPLIRQGKLQEILPQYRSPSFNAYAVYQQRDYTPPKVAAFVDFLVHRFSPERWDDGPLATRT